MPSQFLELEATPTCTPKALTYLMKSTVLWYTSTPSRAKISLKILSFLLPKPQQVFLSGVSDGSPNSNLYPLDSKKD
jgi:hypothetical protein